MCKSHQLHKSDKYCQTSNEDSFKLKYLELENTRMATEIKFLRDQILEKDFIIRSLFMSKSVNRDNNDFSRNIKNQVDNVNKNVTPSSPLKNFNTDKNVNNSNIQSNNNFATPADIFNRDNEKELSQSPDICINKNIIIPSPTLYGGSQTNTPQNLTRETEYNHRASSFPITEAPEKPTNKTVISKDRDPSLNLEIAESSYPSSDLQNSVKRKSPAEKNLQESQIGLRNAKEREKNVKELTKSPKNDEEKVATSNEHWKNGTTLIMGDSTVSGLMEKKMSRNRKVKIRFFPGAKIKDMFHYAIPLLEKKPDYVILHVGTNDAPYKGGSDISKEILELMRFIKEKHPGCKKITLSAPIIRTDNYNANKENERFISSLNKSDVSYITHDNIIKKHLYRDGLHLNRIGFTILAENFLSFIRRD